MADPPFERPLGDRIGADSELVRSLASLEDGPAGRIGRHDRPGRSQLIGEVEMIDRKALLHKSCSLSMLGGAWTDGTMTDLQWRHFTVDVILWAVRGLCRSPHSYPDLV